MKSKVTHSHLLTSPFLYFVAGIVGATGINLATSVVSSVERSIDSIVVIVGSLLILVISYWITKLASVYAAYEKLIEERLPFTFTDSERRAAIFDLSYRRELEIRRPKRYFLFISAVVLVFFAVREFVSFGGGTADEEIQEPVIASPPSEIPEMPEE